MKMMSLIDHKNTLNKMGLPKILFQRLRKLLPTSNPIIPATTGSKRQRSHELGPSFRVSFIILIYFILIPFLVHQYCIFLLIYIAYIHTHIYIFINVVKNIYIYMYIYKYVSHYRRISNDFSHISIKMKQIQSEIEFWSKYFFLILPQKIF